MGLIEEEVVAAVAATVAVVSPRARKVARKGAVYGVAGVLKAGDVVAAAARGVARGAGSSAPTEQPTTAPTKEVARKRAPGVRRAPSRSARSRPDEARSDAGSTGAAS